VDQPLLQFELTNEFRDRFQEAIDRRDNQFIRSILEDVNPADITSLLYEFDSEESKYVLDLLTIEIQSEIISDLDPDSRRRFLKVYHPGEISTFLNHLASDDAADILNPPQCIRVTRTPSGRSAAARAISACSAAT
jgi:magnesium transporter